MTNHESSHEQARPEPTPDNFDAWLTQLPDDELLRLSIITNQAFVEHPDDPLGLAEVVTMAMRFRGKPAMSVAEVEDAFSSFSIQLALERMVRDGDAVKTGAYSLIPGEDRGRFSMTEQGQRKWDEHHKRRP